MQRSSGRQADLTDENDENSDAGMGRGSKGEQLTSSLTKRAGLQFSVDRFLRHTRRTIGDDGPEIEDNAGVYLAAVLEYLAAELLEASGIAAKLRRTAEREGEERDPRITPLDVLQGVRDHAELSQLFTRPTSFSSPEDGEVEEGDDQDEEAAAETGGGSEEDKAASNDDDLE